VRSRSRARKAKKRGLNFRKLAKIQCPSYTEQCSLVCLMIIVSFFQLSEFGLEVHHRLTQRQIPYPPDKGQPIEFRMIHNSKGYRFFNPGQRNPCRRNRHFPGSVEDPTCLAVPKPAVIKSLFNQTRKEIIRFFDAGGFLFVEAVDRRRNPKIDSPMITVFSVPLAESEDLNIAGSPSANHHFGIVLVGGQAVDISIVASVDRDNDNILSATGNTPDLALLRQNSFLLFRKEFTLGSDIRLKVSFEPAKGLLKLSRRGNFHHL